MEEIRAAVGGYLEPGEKPEAAFNAVMPTESRDRGMTLVWLWPIIMTVRYVMWRSSVRKAGQDAGVQLAPRMLITLTSQRLIIVRASRRWSPREIIGGLPRNQIEKVRLGAASSRTRRLTLHLANGQDITLRMTRQAAEQLSNRLSVAP